MIIGAVGFSWSGSSAVSDLLMEFENTQVYPPEFIFPYYPDGIEDLDYHLNQQCAKFLSSILAFARFRQVADYLLKDATHGKIKKLTEEYLGKLEQVSWVGSGLGIERLHPEAWKIRIRRFIYVRILVKYFSPEFCRKHKIYPLRKISLSIQPEHFLEYTQDYLDKILEAIGLDLSKNIVLDQPFPGNNPEKCMSYFRNSKAIIVDRDPRDLYLIVKEYYKNRCYQYPNNAADFVTYFRSMRSPLSKAVQNPNVLYIRFEDLVYNYESTVERISSFLGIGAHISPKKYFVPEMSMNNTRLFEKCKKYQEDIAYIEKELPEYLFPFEGKVPQQNNESLFDSNPRSRSYDYRNIK